MYVQVLRNTAEGPLDSHGQPYCLALAPAPSPQSTSSQPHTTMALASGKSRENKIIATGQENVLSPRVGYGRGLSNVTQLAIPAGFTTDPNVIFWTSRDPRESVLFSSEGVLYRFSTEMFRGRPATILSRTVRRVLYNQEERVARLEWGLDGGFGRVSIG